MIVSDFSQYIAGEIFDSDLLPVFPASCHRVTRRSELGVDTVMKRMQNHLLFVGKISLRIWRECAYNKKKSSGEILKNGSNKNMSVQTDCEEKLQVEKNW